MNVTRNQGISFGAHVSVIGKGPESVKENIIRVLTSCGDDSFAHGVSLKDGAMSLTTSHGLRGSESINVLKRDTDDENCSKLINSLKSAANDFVGFMSQKK